MPRTFSGQEFLAALTTGNLPDPIFRKGIVKNVKDDKNVIQFSGGTSGEQWTTIPVDMIDKVDHIANVSSGGQEFPFVRLYLKEPSDDNMMAKVLASLLRVLPRTPHASGAVGEHRTKHDISGS